MPVPRKVKERNLSLSLEQLARGILKFVSIYSVRRASSSGSITRFRRDSSSSSRIIRRERPGVSVRRVRRLESTLSTISRILVCSARNRSTEPPGSMSARSKSGKSCTSSNAICSDKSARYSLRRSAAASRFPATRSTWCRRKSSSRFSCSSVKAIRLDGSCIRSVNTRQGREEQLVFILTAAGDPYPALVVKSFYVGTCDEDSALQQSFL